MKIIIATIFIFTHLLCLAQEPKLNIDGNWICTKITDANGHLSNGKYGYSNEYLRFVIDENNISISESPFDLGFAYPIKFENNDSTLVLSPEIDLDFDEKTYKIKYFTHDSLILETNSLYNGLLSYTFINHPFSPDDNNPIHIECGTIVLKHILNKGGTIRHTGYNDISSNESLYGDCPVFYNPNYLSLAQYLTEKFNFPKNLRENPYYSSNLVVEFEYTANGMNNLKVYGKNTPDTKLVSDIYNLIKKTKKHWHITNTEIDNENISYKIKMHFKLVFIRNTKQS